MNWFYKRATILISSAVVLGLQMAAYKNLEAIGLTSTQGTTEARIRNIAREITVVITRPNNLNQNKRSFAGTGVIIARSNRRYSNRTYYVLATKHSVKKGTKQYQIVTSDGKHHQIKNSNVDLLPEKLDLVLLEFTGNSNYELTCIGNSEELEPETSVYLSGWVKSEVKSEGEPRFTSGKITERIDRKYNLEGYNLVYDNKADNGMSGGPLLNTDGCVVGIHGRRQAITVWGNDNLGIGINRIIETLEIINAQYPQESPDNLWAGDREGMRAEKKWETAKLPTEWSEVASGWEIAIALLQEVPEENRYKYANAQRKIAQYQKNLDYARDMVEKSQAAQEGLADPYYVGISQVSAIVSDIWRTEQMTPEVERTPQDWRDIAALWGKALRFMEAVPGNHPLYQKAQKKKSEYRRNLEDSETAANQLDYLALANDAELRATEQWQKAKFPDDWREVKKSWEEAVNILEKLPQKSYSDEVKIQKYQDILIHVQDMLNRSILRPSQPQPDIDPYWAGLREGVTASGILYKKQREGTSLSRKDWQEIAEHWRNGIDFLNRVSSNHPLYGEARRKIPAYQKNLDDVQSKILGYPQNSTSPRPPTGAVKSSCIRRVGGAHPLRVWATTTNCF